MAERPPSPADRDLERALTDLGSRLAYPPTPDLARAVQRRLATEPPRRRFPLAEWMTFTPARRRLAVAALTVLLVVAAALAVSPDLRSAVASRLGIKGFTLTFVDEVPTPAPSPVGAPLLLGQQVTLEEARSRTPYEILIPSHVGLGSPDEVYLGNPETPGRTVDSVVTLVYRARDGLPSATESGLGLLLSQYAGEEGFLYKKVIVGGTTPVVEVTVNGNFGMWFEGAPHLFIYRDPVTGREEERLAGNVLLWEQNGRTFRLESALSRDEAIAIAASME